MDLHFTCRKCGGDTGVELGELTEDPVLICEECGQEADPTLVGDVAATLEEMTASAGRLSRSFVLSFELKGSEDLPAPAFEEDEDEEAEEEL